MLRIIMHRQIQRVELICRVLICNLLGFVQISVGQNDFESSSCFLSSLRLLLDGAAVEDNLQGENRIQPKRSLVYLRDEMRSIVEYL